MKLIYCLECGDIFSPGTDAPKTCNCRYSIGQWIDPQIGTLRVASRDCVRAIRVLGINNNWLAAVKQLGSDDLMHRHWNRVTSERAEGYLFKTRECPIIMVWADSGGQIVYDRNLLNEVEWFGKFDCAKREATT